MVLSLAFMTEEKADRFTFSKDAYRNHVKGTLGNAFKNMHAGK
jgi:hypothetical protein